MMTDTVYNLPAVCLTFWLQRHNNPRYAALFPQLTALVRFHKVVFSRHRVLNAIQYRAWRALDRRLIYPLALNALQKRYQTLFTVDLRQVPFWKGNVVIDCDDPTYSAVEISYLRLPQVRAIVVTTDRAKDILHGLGVDKPTFVVPQGISVQADLARIQDLRRRYAADSDIVVGYAAPTMTLSVDGPHRFREGLDDLDFLFETVEAARAVDPRIKLWLVGQVSASVRAYAESKRWVTIVEYVPLSDVFNHVSCFDIGVYPRAATLPPGRFSVKLAQYMACGVPIVATAVDEASMVRLTDSGIVCESPQTFSQALVQLAGSPDLRARFGQTGKAYAESRLSWSSLVPRYTRIIQDAIDSKSAA